MFTDNNNYNILESIEKSIFLAEEDLLDGKSVQIKYSWLRSED